MAVVYGATEHSTKNEEEFGVRKTDGANEEARLLPPSSGKAFQGTTTSSPIEAAVRWLFAVVWASCAALGVYTIGYYLVRSSFCGYQIWDYIPIVPGLYRPDAPASSAGLVAHFASGALIMLGMPLQLVPALRRGRFLPGHRLRGRLLLAASVVVVSGVGVYLATVGSVGGPVEDILNTVVGILILVSTIQSYRHAAITKQIDLHKLWSCRLWMLFVGMTIFVRFYTYTMILLWGDIKGWGPGQAIAYAIPALLWYVPGFWAVDAYCAREKEEEPHRHASSSWVAAAALGAAALVCAGMAVVYAAVFWLPALSHDPEDLPVVFSALYGLFYPNLRRTNPPP